MFYGRLTDRNITDPNKQIGLGAFVRYDEGDMGELLHFLRFLKNYREAHEHAEGVLPQIANHEGQNLPLDDLIARCEESEKRGEDILTPVLVFFYNVHQLLFREYKEYLDDDVAAEEDFKKFFARIEEKYFGAKNKLH